MYIFFYIAFRFMKTEKQKFLLLIGFTVFYCVVAWRAGLKNYWYNTCFFFPIGVLLANRQAILLPIIRKPWAMIISGTLTVTVFVMIYFFGRMGMDFFVDGFYMLFFNIFLLGLFGKIGRSVFLNILGKYSMEIYLAHLLLLNTHIYGLFSPEKGTTYLLLIFLTVAVSAPVYYISNKLTICLKNVLKKKKAV